MQLADMICALFGPYAAMFVNRIYPGKSLKTSFVLSVRTLFLPLLFVSCNKYCSKCALINRHQQNKYHSTIINYHLVPVSQPVE